ncbi:hypothetical protein M2119_000057 [Aurantimicrobium minutum]|uniref:DUF3499 family protein n=1 Tax=Aurantimicrobium minutum TaxID=708131 RepID=UPI0024740257|nr:DUF3499 family protein [Aurantimicrobium minutum]MDH6531820.1 hypothetical protein [Aurantimicrobium minutum]
MSSKSERPCSKGRCLQPAEFSLTYDYDDQLAVVGPLSPEPESLAHDLCVKHARGFTAPQGWELIRHLDLINE